jgi:pimeloyl-ACP methyl ester carboxylesterase
VKLAAWMLLLAPAVALAAQAYGPELEGFAYPYPVSRFEFTSQRQKMHMAFMDVRPGLPNGRVVVLLHGKNFCAATWGDTIAALAAAGYRTIAPDQIGFCKSTKPQSYQYTFQQLAFNTHALLQSLGLPRASILGHSTGGMLAVRYALMYPQEVEQLVLANPIGLEDWKARGVPPIGLDDWYAGELKVNADSIRRYEREVYYAGTWQQRYETWVDMLAGLNAGPERELVAWNSAAIYDMIFTQPVLYEFPLIRVPTLLLIGDRDTTAIGRERAPPEVRAALGHYPELGRNAAAQIPHARLVEFPDLGHAPMIQDPAQFQHALLTGLKELAGE